MLVRLSQILNLVSRFSDILEIIENCLEEEDFIPGLNSNYFDEKVTYGKKKNLSRQRKASKRENDKLIHMHIHTHRHKYIDTYVW